jgi:hypothetical protein
MVGMIERGFDFLGYHFGPEGLAVARANLQNNLSVGCCALRYELEELSFPASKQITLSR